MNLISIAKSIYCDPWLISPDMHKVLCDIVEAHIAGGEAEQARRALGEALVQSKAAITGKDEGKVEDKPVYQIMNGIAVIPLYGVIGKRVGMLEQSSGVTDVDVFSRAVMRATNDPNVKRIMIDIDSPGGTVGGVQHAADVVRMAASQKKTMAYTGGTCASAAYWIASGADAIYCDATASVGSIGVYTMVLDTSRAYDNMGIKNQVFASGKFKAAGASGTSLSDEQKEQIQKVVDDLASVFKADILRHNPAIAQETMQGQVFVGQSAKLAGLVDSICSFEKAMDDLLKWE